MALKRPAEKHWNFRTPPAVFPQTPGANGCFLAPSGQGKTTTLIAMLLAPYTKAVDEIHILSRIHIPEPTRLRRFMYAALCSKK